jgi:hypothetical protein
MYYARYYDQENVIYWKTSKINILRQFYSVREHSNLNDYPNAEGFCYKTEWGDWVCQMTDLRTNKTIAKETAPPK